MKLNSITVGGWVWEMWKKHLDNQDCKWILNVALRGRHRLLGKNKSDHN